MAEVAHGGGCGWLKRVDLTSVREVVDARRELPWARGDAWLAGGTFLFAEPRPGLVRLRDLTAMGWQPLTVTDEGLNVAATCTIAELLAFAEDGPGPWPRARETIAQCCRAFSSSPKVWSTATVGGNICLALPAAPMISLAVAFDGVLELRSLDGDGRVVPAAEFVTGAGQTVLRPGEVLRSLVLPSAVLGLRSGMRRAALRPQGRSAAAGPLRGCGDRYPRSGDAAADDRYHRRGVPPGHGVLSRGAVRRPDAAVRARRAADAPDRG